MELVAFPSIRRHVFSRPDLANLFVVAVGLKVDIFCARRIYDFRLKSKVVPSRSVAERDSKVNFFGLRIVGMPVWSLIKPGSAASEIPFIDRPLPLGKNM
jgi:hypothetical protein